jgi:hypothetical protein
MWYIYTIRYYSTIKKNEVMSFAEDRTGNYHVKYNKPG